MRSQHLRRRSRGDAAHPKLGNETPSSDASLKVREFWRPALALNSSAQTLVRLHCCRRAGALLGLGADALDWDPLKTKLPSGRILPERKAGGILPKRVGNEGLGVRALIT